jgi:hypothetical protein
MPETLKPVELTEKEIHAQLIAKILAGYPARWRWLARIGFFIENIGWERRHARRRKIPPMNPSSSPQ